MLRRHVHPALELVLRVGELERAFSFGWGSVPGPLRRRLVRVAVVMSNIDLGEVGILDVDGGRVVVTPPVTVAVEGANGTASLEVPGLVACISVASWVDEDWCCLVGLEDRHLVEAVPLAGLVRVIGELKRLDFDGRYDPGGFERVRYHRLDRQDVLIEYEVGVARASRHAGLRWDVAHGDVTARIVEVDEAAVWLEGENQRFGLSLSDGTLV